MAKIRKLDVTIDRKPTELLMYYTGNKGFFFRGLPEKWKRITEFRNSFSTESDLLKHFYEKNKEYHKETQTEEKVIIIEFAVGMASKFDRTGIGSWSSKKGIGSLENLKLQWGLGFSFKIMSKIKGDRIKYAEIWNGEISSYSNAPIMERKDSKVEIPYSEEAEFFLNQTAKACDEMAIKFKNFFQSEELELKIKAGNNLLSNE